MCLTAGQVSDYKGAKKLIDVLPAAQYMLADRGYDADWFRDDLRARGITPCKVMDDVIAWQNRPLEKLYPIVYLDCIHIKTRDNHMPHNKAVYIALALNMEGKKRNSRSLDKQE